MNGGGAPKHQNQKFKRKDEEGQRLAVVVAARIRAWVTLTSSEVGLDHPCKLSERAEKSHSRSCDDLKTVRGGLQCDGQV